MQLSEGPLKLKHVPCSASWAPVRRVNKSLASRDHGSGMSICLKTLRWGATSAALQTYSVQMSPWEVILQPRRAFIFSVHFLVWHLQNYISWEFLQPAMQCWILDFRWSFLKHTIIFSKVRVEVHSNISKGVYSLCWKENMLQVVLNEHVITVFSNSFVKMHTT